MGEDVLVAEICTKNSSFSVGNWLKFKMAEGVFEPLPTNQ